MDGECEFVVNSQAMKNFVFNKKYNVMYSCDFMSIEWELDMIKEYMEFAAINEFNKVRGKEFIPLEKFQKVYREAD